MRKFSKRGLLGLSVKEASIVTPLLPHQERAVRKALADDIILAHSVGSGKTLSAIAAADAIGKPAVVFTPAPLVDNFRKEIERHKKGGPPIKVLSLPTAMSRHYKVPEGATVVVDEAHMLRNRGTSRDKYMREQLKGAGRVIGLTGTPVYNNPYDIAQLVNVVSRRDEFPSDPKEFASRYLNEEEDSPGFFARLFGGVSPGSKVSVRKDTDLGKLLRRHVDLEEVRRELPDVLDETINVDMSRPQTDAYSYVTRGMPWNLLYKVTHNISPEKSEAKRLNAFLAGARQVSNTPEAISPDVIDSPKLDRAVKELRALLRKNRKARALVYSNYLGAGVLPYARRLDKLRIPYGIFDGSTPPEERRRLVADYNSGKLPVLLGTGSASEGLDLKGTRLIQILEPHWNDSRLAQVVGRGVRYRSHDDLPKKDRNVRVQRFVSRLPEEGWLFKRRRTSSDEYLTERAREKKELANEIRDLLKGDE